MHLCFNASFFYLGLLLLGFDQGLLLSLLHQLHGQFLVHLREFLSQTERKTGSKEMHDTQELAHLLRALHELPDISSGQVGPGGPSFLTEMLRNSSSA